MCESDRQNYAPMNVINSPIKTPCPFCAGRSQCVSEQDRRGGPLVTLCCESCGLIFNDPIPGDDELRDFYSDRYRIEYKGRFQPRPRQVARSFRRASALFRDHGSLVQKHRRVLDVGAGSGEFVFLAKQLGFDVTGIEPNLGYVDYCRESLGLDLLPKSIFECDFAKGSFDFIRINHVLEHLNKPMEVLALLRHWLKDDGVLFIEVPNIEEYIGTKAYSSLFHYGHIFNFNPVNLRALAASAGFAELPELVKAQENLTASFFAKSAPKDPVSLVKPENAAKIMRLLAEHRAKRRPVSRQVWKMLRRLRRRLSEHFLATTCGTPQGIGLHYAKALRRQGC